MLQNDFLSCLVLFTSHQECKRCKDVKTACLHRTHLRDLATSCDTSCCGNFWKHALTWRFLGDTSAAVACKRPFSLAKSPAALLALSSPLEGPAPGVSCSLPPNATSCLHAMSHQTRSCPKSGFVGWAAYTGLHHIHAFISLEKRSIAAVDR